MWRISLPLAAVLLTSSCFRHQKQAAPVMIPPPVIVEVPKQTPKQPAPPPPLPPGQGGPAVTLPPQSTAQQVIPPPPKRNKKKNKKRAEEVQAAAATPPVETPPQQQAPAAPQASLPQLTQVLGEDQRREFETSIRELLDSARKNLTAVKDRQLSTQQQTMRSQVESFVVQAEETKKTDLVAARSLAQRADLLSKDLVDSIH